MKTSEKIKNALNILFWGSVTIGCVYSVKLSIDELRDPLEKEKRKEARRSACDAFDNIMDKITAATKKVYKVYHKIADWDEALDNAIPSYEPEHNRTRLALLKSKREKLDKRINELESLENKDV